MKNLLAKLSLRQRITIALVAALAAGAIAGLVRWNQERDFRPLFSKLAPEDAAAIVGKLKESGVDYRLPEGGGSVLVPSARLAELRLTMAAAGIPKSGRIGFELFDKTNFGATDFTEHINYRRALEGELERSVMSMAEVEQARVHITFPKDSVFLESQQPAKASVLLRLKPGVQLVPQNVQAINHLVASAVEGLSPDAVSVLDMNGNLLGRPKRALPDAPEVSEAALEYRQQIESRVLAKINGALTPLLGEGRYHAGVTVECDFSAGEQSEEVFDPARSVMLTSMRTEDGATGAVASGTPGTASTLPRPTSRPASGASGMTRVTENITYQPTRTVKRLRVPGGAVKKMSVAVLLDHDLTWEKDKAGYRRVLAAPSPEKLKVIRELLAGTTGIDAQRGDVITVESLPFDSTLKQAPPRDPAPAGPAPATPSGPSAIPLPQLTRQQWIAAGGAAVVLFFLACGGLFLWGRKRKRRVRAASPPPAIPAGASSAEALPATTSASGLQAMPGGAGAPALTLEEQIAEKIAQQDALKHEAEARALNQLKLAPVITKTAEVLAKHLRESIKKDAEVPAHILRSWIREEEV